MIKWLAVFLLCLTLSLSIAPEFAAKVSGITLNLTEFDALYLESLESYKKDLLIHDTSELKFSELEDLKYGVLDTMIENMMYQFAARKNRITVSENEVRAYIIDMEKGFASRDDFLKALKEQHIPLGQLRNSARNQIMRDKVIEQAYPEYDHIATQDIVTYLKANDLSTVPIRYTLTLLVSSNVSVLHALSRSFVPEQWENLGINLSRSYFSYIVTDTDLDPAIAAMLQSLPLHKFSDIGELNETDSFIVRVNQMEYSLPTNFTQMAKDVRRSISAEKKARFSELWVAEQKKRQRIIVNLKRFPYYYKRESLPSVNPL